VLTSSTSPNYLNVYECTTSSTSTPASCAVWSAPSSGCEIYVANWTDTSISVVLNLPVNVQSTYQQDYEGSPPAYLSPLSYSWENFLAASGCSVTPGDYLYFCLRSSAGRRGAIDQLQVDLRSCTEALLTAPVRSAAHLRLRGFCR
jgi:hypothetical protein